VSRYALAIDIVAHSPTAVLLRSDGRSYSDKTLTTPRICSRDSSAHGSGARARRHGLAGVDDVVVHATTLVTNVLIERKGLRRPDRHGGLSRCAVYP